jgi:serine palmitoyltransferase
VIGPFLAFFVYASYGLLILVGHFRDFLGALTGITRYPSSKPSRGYAVLLKSWESFYTRRLYHRIQDCWNRPICSSPGAHIKVMERDSADHNCTLRLTGRSIDALNMGSYNYLGFGDNWEETCGKEVLECLSKWPVSSSSSRACFGSYTIIEELETFIADFLGKESALVYSMGYGTNSNTIPALMGPESLIISDSLNHTSLVNGSRGSTAQIRVFHHNDPKHLEEILRESIVNGQPRHSRPWKKILVMVEGIYSMEGAISNLKEIVRICKKYKAYIYVDEAHSIGALGPTGRGVCEQTGVDTKDIDILMGTFSKSFGGMGGYICGSKAAIDQIRSFSNGFLHHNSLSPVVAKQVLTAFKIIASPDPNGLGQRKLKQLKDNSNFFRSEMERLGFHTYGDMDSPIVPVLIYFPAKVAAFSRECLKRGVAVVVVGFPATSVVLSRARFCISASHTHEDLVHAVKVIDEVTELLCLKYHKNFIGSTSL